jgi:hypothetical protein
MRSLPETELKTLNADLEPFEPVLNLLTLELL